MQQDDVDADADQLFEVESVVSHKLLGGGYRFLIHWKGYSSDEDTWEPLENLEGAISLVYEYCEQRGIDLGRKKKKKVTKKVHRAREQSPMSVVERKSVRMVLKNLDSVPEAILCKGKLVVEGGKMLFLVKWTGKSLVHCTWEKKENLKGAEKLFSAEDEIKEFELLRVHSFYTETKFSYSEFLEHMAEFFEDPEQIEIEKVLDVRKEKFALVKWKKMDYLQCTWENIEELEIGSHYSILKYQENEKVSKERRTTVSIEELFSTLVDGSEEMQWKRMYECFSLLGNNFWLCDSEFRSVVIQFLVRIVNTSACRPVCIVCDESDIDLWTEIIEGTQLRLISLKGLYLDEVDIVRNHELIPHDQRFFFDILLVSYAQISLNFVGIPWTFVCLDTSKIDIMDINVDCISRFDSLCFFFASTEIRKFESVKELIRVSDFLKCYGISFSDDRIVSEAEETLSSYTKLLDPFIISKGESKFREFILLCPSSTSEMENIQNVYRKYSNIFLEKKLDPISFGRFSDDMLRLRINSKLTILCEYIQKGLLCFGNICIISHFDDSLRDAKSLFQSKDLVFEDHVFFVKASYSGEVDFEERMTKISLVVFLEAFCDFRFLETKASYFKPDLKILYLISKPSFEYYYFSLMWPFRREFEANVMLLACLLGARETFKIYEDDMKKSNPSLISRNEYIFKSELKLLRYDHSIWGKIGLKFSEELIVPETNVALNSKTKEKENGVPLMVNETSISKPDEPELIKVTEVEDINQLQIEDVALSNMEENEQAPELEELKDDQIPESPGSSETLEVNDIEEESSDIKDIEHPNISSVQSRIERKPVPVLVITSEDLKTSKSLKSAKSASSGTLYPKSVTPASLVISSNSEKDPLSDDHLLDEVFEILFKFGYGSWKLILVKLHVFDIQKVRLIAIFHVVYLIIAFCSMQNSFNIELLSKHSHLIPLFNDGLINDLKNFAAIKSFDLFSEKVKENEILNFENSKFITFQSQRKGFVCTSTEAIEALAQNLKFILSAISASFLDESYDEKYRNQISRSEASFQRWISKKIQKKINSNFSSYVPYTLRHWSGLSAIRIFLGTTPLLDSLSFPPYGHVIVNWGNHDDFAILNYACYNGILDRKSSGLWIPSLKVKFENINYDEQMKVFVRMNNLIDFFLSLCSSSKLSFEQQRIEAKTEVEQKVAAVEKSDFMPRKTDKETANFVDFIKAQTILHGSRADFVIIKVLLDQLSKLYEGLFLVFHEIEIKHFSCPLNVFPKLTECKKNIQSISAQVTKCMLYFQPHTTLRLAKMKEFCEFIDLQVSNLMLAVSKFKPTSDDYILQMLDNSNPSPEFSHLLEITQKLHSMTHDYRQLCRYLLRLN